MQSRITKIVFLSTIVFSASVQAASTGLVAAYAFNEASGATTADSSGSGNNGALNATTWSAAGKFGSALSFNGTSSWVTVADSASLDLKTAFTIEAWVNPSVRSGWQVVAMKEVPGGLAYALYANTSANVPAGALHTTTDINLYGSSAVPVNTWTHLAVTYDGSRIRLYVNGTEVNNQARTGQMPVSTSPLRIGGDAPWGEYFKGLIDEVRIYNRAITAAEVASDMTTPISTASQTGITVTPPTVSLVTKGATQQLTVMGSFSDGSSQNQTADPTTLYSSTDTSIATVSTGGLITAVANGSATINVTHGSFAGSSSVTVNIPPPVLTGISVSPSPMTLAIGAKQQLTVLAAYSDGSFVNVTNFATYGSTNSGVANVTTGGLVTAVPTGSATITAQYSGFNGGASVTVPPALTGITVAPSTVTLTTKGATQALTVTANYSDGSTQNVTTLSSFGSSSTGAATVSASGIVTAVANGTAIITATYQSASNASTVTVNIPPPTLTGVSVSPSSVTLSSIGAKQQLTVTGTYSDSTTKDVTASATFNSANTAIATVSSSGQVTAVAVGNTSVTASYSGFNSNSAITVSTTVTGLVAAYSFNEGTGTTVIDSSGNGNNGTISNGTWTNAGRYGKALNFNGTNSWVTVPDSASLDLSTAVTLEAWVRPVQPVSWQAVILKELPTDLSYALYSNTDSDQAIGTVNIAGNTVYVNENSPDSQVPLYGWTHLATTFDGRNFKLYENGILMNSIAASGKIRSGVGALRIGGDSIWGEYFNGAIDEVRIYNRALSDAEIQADVNLPITPPAVLSISASPASTTIPAVNAFQQLTLSATYASGVTEDATLNTGVKYQSGNTAIATVDATGLVKAIANGSTTITASYGGYSQTIPTSVAVSSDPAVMGQWSSPFDLSVVAVNLILLRTGKVLLYGGQLTSGQNAKVFDPATGSITAVPTATDLFCSGHVTLADGRVLVVGGHDAVHDIVGVKDVNIFDPVAMKWTAAPAMKWARWYPTGTLLPDGRVLVTSGAQNCYGYQCLAGVPELYNPTTNTWSSLTAANLKFWYYPLTFLLPNGKVLLAGTSEQVTPTIALDVASQTWTTVDANPVDGGSATMYSPGLIMKSGTAADAGGPNVPATNTTYVLDANQASPQWQQTAPMAVPRAFHNLTVLPDGNVLVTGGEKKSDGSSNADAVYQAELWSPSSKTWRTLSLGSVPRLYHSTAVLLPDARVLVAGSGSLYPAADQTQGEYFSPPYLFKGPRPTITSTPATAAYGSSFNVQTPDAADIASVALIRPSAVTHQFNEDQFFVNLSFQKGSGQLTLQAPNSPNIAPPGYYMLFLVNSNGVPSVAPFLKLQ